MVRVLPHSIETLTKTVFVIGTIVLIFKHIYVLFLDM